MAKYFLVETWRPRPEWYALSKEQKSEFVEQVSALLSGFVDKGAKVLGLGRCRALSESGWDATGFWEMPNAEMVIELAEAVERLGWNHYFDQINTVSSVSSPAEYFGSLLEDRKF